MTNSTKAALKEKELDTARCKGNWNEIPELARKYKKHNPDGVVLEQTALAEYELVQAIQKKEKQAKFSLSAYDGDGPDYITLPPIIDESEITDGVFGRLENAKARIDDANKDYTFTVLGRALFVVGKYKECLETLNALRTALELTGDAEGAVKCYNEVAHQLAQQPGEKCDQAMYWAEEALYRSSLLNVRHGNVSAALRSFRTYQVYAATWSTFRINKRAVIFRHFIKFLSNIYNANEYVPPSDDYPSVGSNDQQNSSAPRTFRQELTELHSLYENVLYQIVKFPQAGEVNWRVLEMVDQIISDWILLGGGTILEIRGVVEMLYRAAKKTFHSPLIMRHLVNSLIALGEYDEAALALDAYIALVEKAKETQREDMERKLHHAESSAKKFCEIEDASNVIQTVLRGVYLMAKYLNKPKEALQYAQKAVEISEETSTTDDELLAYVWRCVGVAHSVAAREELDPDKRPGLHEEAISALQKSIELDPESVEALYQLALECAITRDIRLTISTIEKALRIDDKNIPCWHLLALSFSAQKDIQSALTACELGVKDSEWETTDSPAEILIGAGNDDGEEFFSFKMTQNTLQELVNGPDAALQNRESLFTLYGRVFPDGGISPYETSSIRKRDMNEDTINSSMKPPGSTRSARSYSNSRREVTDDTVLSVTNRDKLDVPKTTYATSISSKNSAGSGIGQSPTPTISGIVSAKSVVGSSSTSRPTARIRQRRQRSAKELVTLWLSTASSFRRQDDLGETLKAIQNAEEIDGANPDVWCQFGLLQFAQENYDKAISAFHKAISIDPQHVPSLVHLGRTYIQTGNIEMAEGVLDSVTKGNGWDCAEAWYFLGNVFETTNRIERAKKCLWYALDLESTKPVRPFSVLPKCL
ncbi:1508_t:CDS:10 [Paraglomus brasilianum]|uniref:1508_t:CDS:1 n=1 Tax=Paraglomus brasilianum TaxID=144538 RepID=A0A9N9A424_9GLOM|nr:1508_t:CDS:10 [Paraglomus brasilianum]